MENHCKKTLNMQVQLYKSKPRITYLLIAANIFLLLALYQEYFRYSVIDIDAHIQTGAIFVLTAGQKTISQGQKTMSVTISFFVAVLSS